MTIESVCTVASAIHSDAAHAITDRIFWYGKVITGNSNQWNHGKFTHKKTETEERGEKRNVTINAYPLIGSMFYFHNHYCWHSQWGISHLHRATVVSTTLLLKTFGISCCLRDRYRLSFSHRMIISFCLYGRTYLWRIHPSSKDDVQFCGRPTICHGMAIQQWWPPAALAKGTALHSV